MALQTGTTQYGQQTLVGNWSEDVQEEEIQFAEYLARKKANKLLLSERHTVFQHALQPSPLTFKLEGEALCFGDAVMLENSETGGRLAVHPQGKEWAVSTWPLTEVRPVSRNVFRIEPPPGESDLAGTPLRYGDVFALICDPALTADSDGVMLEKAWLACEPKSYQRVSKLASESDVFVTTTTSERTEWKVESCLPGDSGWRVNVARGPIKVGDSVLIKHRMSNLALSSSLKFCFHGKLSGNQEFETFGKPVPKPAAAQTWQFCVASEPALALDDRALYDLTPAIAREAVRSALSPRMDSFWTALERIEACEPLEDADIVQTARALAPELHIAHIESFLASVEALTVAGLQDALLVASIPAKGKVDDEEDVDESKA